MQLIKKEFNDYFKENLVKSLDNDIRYYVKKINKFPNLNKSEEQELIYKYKNEKDLKARDLLILSHLKFVVKIAFRYNKYANSLKDLIQEGNYALLEALEKYKLNKNVRFKSYAIYWIKARIYNFILYKNSSIKLPSTAIYRYIFFHFFGSDSKENIEKNIKKFLKKHNIKEEKLAEILKYINKKDISLDQELDNNITFKDLIEANLPSPEEELISKEQKEKLKKFTQKAINELNNREKFIIFQRFFKDPPLTLQEIGDMLGISRERVRQIEKRTLQKIKIKLKKHKVIK